MGHATPGLNTLIKDLHLLQASTSASRYRKGHDPSNLDLIFTDEELMVEELTRLSPLGQPYHVALL